MPVGDRQGVHLARFARITDDAVAEPGCAIEDQARLFGSARLFAGAKLWANAHVGGNAIVNGPATIGLDAELFDSRHYMIFGPIGREDRVVTVYRTVGGGHKVHAGCWNEEAGGTLDELEERIHQRGGGLWHSGIASQHEAEYQAFIDLARLRVAEWARK